MPPETLDGPALFLSASFKARVSLTPLNRMDEASRRATRASITTAPTQLLYHDIERTSYFALNNPHIDFVHCLWKRNGLMILQASRYRPFSMRSMLHAFKIEGHRSIRYGYVVHTKLGGYAVVDEGQQPVLKRKTIMKLVVHGSDSTMGIGKDLMIQSSGSAVWQSTANLGGKVCLLPEASCGLVGSWEDLSLIYRSCDYRQRLGRSNSGS